MPEAPESARDRIEAVRLELRGSPPDQHALFARAQAHAGAGRPLESLEVCRHALALWPGHPAFATLLFNAASALGDPGEAWRALESATAHVPDNPELLSNLAAAANSSATAEPERVFGFHAAYGRALRARAPAPPLAPVAEPDPERPLRVGIVSYDFRTGSSVSFFLTPLLERADRSRFRILAYQTRELSEPMTAWSRSRADGWRVIREGDTAGLARAIAGDGVDIAVEINGHSGPRTLPAFEPRCAPVQVSYLGYSNTTGVASMDWRIVDSVTDPPGAERLATERLWRLDPCFICYTPPPEAPRPASRPPCLAGDGVTFGALSDLAKLNDEVLGGWARVLAAVPGSRLLLKNRAVEHPDSGAWLRARLEGAGIDLSRVELLPRTVSLADHLAVYNRIDIALDTWPYNGTTTVCEALLMGVPLLTFRPAPRHDRHAARVAMSILSAAGLPELIAKDADAFVAAAVALARDAERLEAYRAGLRDRLLGSAVCDGAAFAQRFFEALRGMWKERVRG